MTGKVFKRWRRKKPAQTPHAQRDFLQFDTLCSKVYADLEAADEASKDWIDKPCKTHAAHSQQLWPTCNARHDPYDTLVRRKSVPSSVVAATVQGNNSSSAKPEHASITFTL